MAEYTEKKTQLIINTLDRKKYDQLCANGEIQYDQLYFVEDDVLDAFNKRVVNVSMPISATDAASKEYVDSSFIKTTNVDEYVDRSKLYSTNNVSYPYGTRYIDGAGRIFEKQDTLAPSWNITVISGDVQPEDITISWSGVTYGWEFKFGEKSYFGTNKTEMADVSRVASDGYNILARRIWPQVDSYISKKTIYSCISNITEDSQLTSLCEAICKLNEKVSAYAG